MSSAFRTRALRSRLAECTPDQLRDIITQLCESHGNIRFETNVILDEMLQPKTRTPARARAHAKSALAMRSTMGGESPSPGGRSRSKSPSHLKSVMMQPSLFTRLPPKAARVRVFRNGSNNEFEMATVAASSMDEFLRLATDKLGLVAAARKVYDVEGNTVTTLDGLENDAVVYVSAGEAFQDPMRHGPRVTTSSIGADHRLVRQTTKRLYAKKNGDPSDDRFIIVAPLPGLYTPAQEMEMLLTDCTAKLNLVACAKRVFTEEGKLVESVAELANGQTIVVSVGEPWHDPADKSPIKRGVKIADDHRLLQEPAKAIRALRNGHKSLSRQATLEKQLDVFRGESVLVVGNTMEKLLESATTRLSLTSAARRLYTVTGELVHEFDRFERGQLYYVSVGEGFIDPMDPTQLAAKQIAELPASSHLNPPPTARMLAFRNGESAIRDAVRVVASSMRQVLEECTRKLHLVASARRLYTTSGVPINSLKDITNDMHVVVSCGEPFKPLDGSRVESLIAPISEGSRLLVKGNIRLNAHRNGWGSRQAGRHIVGASLKELLDEATRVLGLPSAARRMYTEDGVHIKDVNQLSRDMTVYISLGEQFSSSAARSGAGGAGASSAGSRRKGAKVGSKTASTGTST
ncbi:uncharacterized protein AMSG_01015 [Thecamonas trahens ATCC 50062]|uniref:Doublecortin domain-containing protein n=1 Tax=Thecamonas trahens ATCC 50062 TaxID=461836 RepID=A0A0L0DIJ3_THETB|nr:hypothetical protein AMSG_01015 [Thecamonas trahens ATCC 50062]KNC52189.1 hypothetical protein AMSG_01015 [Thecamonas trahens ATCC 50062]|eukprot:XP_013762192.1 hypothetical protein AMSG_01015 [Thecamonas trahens ATCC 50062]